MLYHCVAEKGDTTADKDGLMVEKLDEIKGMLLKMKESTLVEINKAMKSGADSVSGEPSGDIYDQASSERDRELGLLLGDREREKLRNIDEALLKIDEGEYGICLDLETARVTGLNFGVAPNDGRRQIAFCAGQKAAAVNSDCVPNGETYKA